MSEPDEVWRSIAGYEGRYWVSTQGRVKSFFGPSPSGRVLKTTFEDGTDRLYLTRHGERKNLIMRDLVLETFVGPKPAGFIVRHRDGNRANCRLDNLGYGPKSTILPIKSIEDTTRVAAYTPLTADDARAIAASTDRAVDLATQYGVTETMIPSIRQGHTWRQATDGYRRTSYRRRTNAKLTEENVRAILDSKEEALDLADEYGVTPSVISQFRGGIVWRDVPQSHAHERLLPDQQTPPGGDDPGSRPMRRVAPPRSRSCRHARLPAAPNAPSISPSATASRKIRSTPTGRACSGRR